MKFKFIFFLFLTYISIFYCHAYSKKDILQQLGDREKVKNALVMNQQWVKYPSYNDRNGWNDLLGNDRNKIINAGKSFLNYQWKVLTASNYLAFTQNGSRIAMEKPNSDNIKAIASLFWAEMAEGKGRFLPKLIDGVYFMCEQTTWILSAHIYMQTKQHKFPDHREDIIDLGTGMNGAMLSWIYYFLHKEFDKSSPIISMRIKHEIEKRVLKPYMERSDFWWQAFNASPETMVNNWNPWCNSNVLQCFMLLENDKEKLADAVYRTMCSVDAFFNYVNSDGACEEGPSYWSGAAGTAFIYLQSLSEITSDKFNLFSQPMIKNMGEFIVSSYIGNGWGVNFADASAKFAGSSPLIYEYGKTVNSHNMQALATILNNHNFIAGSDIRLSLRYYSIRKELDNAKFEIIPSSFTWYPETQFCYMSDKSGDFFAAKGGYNAESHNHNDIGSFIYCIDKMPIIIDAGVGTYTAKTFSNLRYTIWTMQSQYHNLPTINGSTQQFGYKFRSKDVKVNKNKKTFSINLKDAYPKSSNINSWIRSYKFNNKGIIVNDKFELNELIQPNEVNFLTWGNLNFSIPGKVLITVNDRKAELKYDENSFDVNIETINIDDPKLVNVWGNKVYRIVFKSRKMKIKDNYSFIINKQY